MNPVESAQGAFFGGGLYVLLQVTTEGPVPPWVPSYRDISNASN